MDQAVKSRNTCVYSAFSLFVGFISPARCSRNKLCPCVADSALAPVHHALNTVVCEISQVLPTFYSSTSIRDGEQYQWRPCCCVEKRTPRACPVNFSIEQPGDKRTTLKPRTSLNTRDSWPPNLSHSHMHALYMTSELDRYSASPTKTSETPLG